MDETNQPLAGIGVGSGGGLYNRGTATIEHSILNNNSALDFGGAFFGSTVGSSIAWFTSVDIQANSVSNNANDAAGGGFYVETDALIWLEECLLRNNGANIADSRGGLVEGGAVFVNASQPFEDPVNVAE